MAVAVLVLVDAVLAAVVALGTVDLGVVCVPERETGFTYSYSSIFMTILELNSRKLDQSREMLDRKICDILSSLPRQLV